MKRFYNYKSTINKDYWNEQLKNIGQKLTNKDVKLFRSVRNERDDNESLEKIFIKAYTDGLYIPCLTKLKGDCMFESIEHTGLCANHEVFRKSIALLFYLFGDSKIISNELTLKELFDQINEIEYVYCYNEHRLYKYTYYTMCSDMYASGSWSRLPTELILTIISLFFKVRFNIYHDNGFINKICDNDVDKTLLPEDVSANIYLGLLGEYHYVPLIKRPPIGEFKCPKYDVAMRKFHKWAREKADLIGLYTDISENDDNTHEILNHEILNHELNGKHNIVKSSKREKSNTKTKTSQVYEDLNHQRFDDNKVLPINVEAIINHGNKNIDDDSSKNLKLVFFS